MNILFINGSPNKNGNTAALAEELLRGKAYETLNLTDYTIALTASSCRVMSWILSFPRWKRPM